MTSFNFADMFEAVVDEVPERIALVVDGRSFTFGELEVRANRLAHHLAAMGIGPGDHVGIHAYNGPEWVEAMLALYKIRAVPVNVNYRYVSGELSYLFRNADLAGLVVQREFVPRVAPIVADVPTLHHIVIVEDGSGAAMPDELAYTDYEAAVTSGAPGRAFAPRSGDDIHIIYTGGTTGMPKGVMWRQEDIFFALCGGIDAYTNTRVEHPDEFARRIRDGYSGLVFLTGAPLMHGAGQVATLRCLISGDTIVLLRRFDAEDVWRTASATKANTIMITGDAMARPMADALHRLLSELDLSNLLALSSSAAIFSQSIKDEIIEMLPTIVVVDSVGATETGMNGIKIAQHGEKPRGGPATVQASLDSIVVDENFVPVAPGSDTIGRLARTGNIPLGYYNDPERSAQTFLEVDGVRYAIPGDFAKVEADGQITLLGRGSGVINSGGEKIFPEEVEGALKAHPHVFDVLVVGVPDDRWGERVVAVVAPRPGHGPTTDELREHCRELLAAYKAPKQVILVSEIVRSPSGKPDYPWAKEYARAAGGGPSGASDA